MVDEYGVDFANEYEDDKLSELLKDGDGFTMMKPLSFKVDIGRQKLVELRDIGDHALFLGFKNHVYVLTKDFSAFKPNYAYLTDDRFEFKPNYERTWVFGTSIRVCRNFMVHGQTCIIGKIY